MLTTLAGVALAGTPDTVPPEAHTMASAMSEVLPPHWASARIGWIFASAAMPAMPLPLLVDAPMVPATCVPCQLELRSCGGTGLPAESVPQSPVFVQSPLSAGFE